MDKNDTWDIMTRPPEGGWCGNCKHGDAREMNGCWWTECLYTMMCTNKGRQTLRNYKNCVIEPVKDFWEMKR